MEQMEWGGVVVGERAWPVLWYLYISIGENYTAPAIYFHVVEPITFQLSIC